MMQSPVDSPRTDFSQTDREGIPTGIGWRTPHYRDLLERRPAIGFIEVHSENYFGLESSSLGGPVAQWLQRARALYPLSLHGVGLSLGSTDAPDAGHLGQLAELVEQYQPQWVSEHLSWAGSGGVFANDLLPLPYTEESLAVVCSNIQRVQDRLKRKILLENPSRYLSFRHSTIDETEFLTELTTSTGCGLLLDINNIYVSAQNMGFDPLHYLQNIPAPAVEEIHLAGFTLQDDILIDTHSRPVSPQVWSLYSQFLALHGDRPTLIEWDADIPVFDTLLDEAAIADRRRSGYVALGLEGK